MILANTRQRLTRDDAQLALRLLARGSSSTYAEAEEALREGGIDVLLDDRRLLASLLEAPQAAHASLPLFLYVMVRHALCSVQETDRAIADFVSSVLLHFGDYQRPTRIAQHDDQIYNTLAELLADAERGDPTRMFLVRAHLGNYALWLSGVFPDYIEARRWRRGGPDLEYFDELGRRGYELAAEHRLAQQYGLDGLYAAVAARFQRVRIALNRISDRTLFAHHHSAEKLMRQVTDEARAGLLDPAA
jgi:hypothetical protein